MEPHFADGSVALHHGDALEVLRTLPDASVDAVVTDPPYALRELPTDVVTDALTAWLTDDRAYIPLTGAGFMGRDWDKFVPPPALWDECWRVLKPGGHLMAFAAPRTADLMTMSIRLAGFEIRDGIDWIYGSGFPKSLDVSKAIDKQRHDRDDVRRVTAWIARARATAGVTNRDIDGAFGFNGMAGHWTTQGAQAAVPTLEQVPTLLAALRITADDVPDDIRALLIDLNGMKSQPGPAWFAREVLGAHPAPAKPAPGTFNQSYGEALLTAPATEDARRWQGWGTALKPAREPIVVARKPLAGTVAANVLQYGTGALNIDACRVEGAPPSVPQRAMKRIRAADGSAGDVYGLVPGEGRNGEMSAASGRWPANVVMSHAPDCGETCLPGCPVAELDAQSGNVKGAVSNGKRLGNGYAEGFGAMEQVPSYGDSGGASRFFPVFRYQAKAPTRERPRVDGIAHPTVKPLALMRWLVRLVTPPGGVVLEPFAGSGTTVEACALEGFRCIAIEREAAYLPLITTRLAKRIQPALDLPAAS